MSYSSRVYGELIQSSNVSLCLCLQIQLVNKQMDSFTKRYSTNIRETGHLTNGHHSLSPGATAPLWLRSAEVNGGELEEESASWAAEERHPLTARCEDVDLARVMSHLRLYIESMRLKRCALPVLRRSDCVMRIQS